MSPALQGRFLTTGPPGKSLLLTAAEEQASIGELGLSEPSRSLFSASFFIMATTISGCVLTS